MDQSIEYIKNTIKECNYDIAQLHGKESPAYCVELKKSTIVWKAIVVKEKKDIEKAKIYECKVDKILYDGGKGSGEQINFSWLNGIRVDILAGGIGADNIQEAGSKVNPEIIDLNSRIESSHGIKDIQLAKEAIKKIGL